MKTILRMTSTVKATTVKVALKCATIVPADFILNILAGIEKNHPTNNCYYDVLNHSLCIEIGFDPSEVQIISKAIGSFEEFEAVIDKLCDLSSKINGGE